MPPFKDEHVLIIAPGSQTTQTQLGLPETFTPPRWRFPTRMFPGLKDGEWEPVFIRERVKMKVLPKPVPETNGAATKGNNNDVDMQDAVASTAAPVSQTNGEQATTNPTEIIPTSKSDSPLPEAPTADTSTGPQPDVQNEAEAEDETELYDDPLALANAVYPMKAGRIENWPCFFALMSHIYALISPPFHMPVLVVAQPCWTARDREWITQYFFENWKIPAFCLMDSALAATWGYGVPSACVIDVGMDKCDVSAVSEYVVNEVCRGVSIEDCGGAAMTARLREELEKHKDLYKGIDDFTDLAEQLKKSPICEILPAGAPLPGQVTNNVPPQNPAAIATTGGDVNESISMNVPRGPGAGTEVGEEGGADDEDNDGVLDIASIVAQNNAAELLAKREKERAEKEARKKATAGDAAKQIRLKNSEKNKATLTYEEYIPSDEADKTEKEAAQGLSRKRKRDIEIGTERFMVAMPSTGHSDSILDRIAGAVHSTIMGVPDVPVRTTLWENLIVLGNGARVKGFTTALIHTLSSRYTLSPSTATIFTSELPSNFSTPVPTNGTTTPIPGQGSHHMQSHPGSGVNPLLVAATKNMMQPGQHLNVPGPAGPVQPGHMPLMDPHVHQSYRGFTQTPTSMKTVKAPDYFPEWKDPSVAGMEEVAFLGAQVAAKVVFIVDQGASKGFLTRSEYNELGPEGIHGCAM